jgi:hypothetical protein
MKLFNFTIIALGIMIIMYLAGVGNTNSSLIVNSILLKNTTQISASTALPTISTGITNWVDFSNWWKAIGILLGGIVLVGVFKIIIGSYQTTPALDIIYAAFAGGIYSIFVTDIIGLLTYVGSITNYSGWVFWVIASILIPFAVMYSFSLISYIKGND